MFINMLEREANDQVKGMEIEKDQLFIEWNMQVGH